MENSLFSYYRPPVSSAVVPTESLTLSEVYKRITTDRELERETDTLQGLLLSDGEEIYRKRKRESLPSVTFGGVFDYRSGDPRKLAEKGKTGLLSLSGYLVIDIDHISQTGVSLEELRDRLSKDREIGLRLIFVSPSGDGLKLVCKTSSQITDSQSYKGVFNSLRHYINSHYSPSGEIVDKSGSDITRLCFLPFDSQAILREWEDTFSAERHPVPRPERPSQEEDYSELLREFDRLPDPGDGVEEIVQRVEDSGLDIAPEYSDYIPLVYSFTSLGERGRSLLHRVCRLSPKYSREDTEKDWEECRKSSESQSIGYFVNLAKRAGIDVSPTPSGDRKERRQKSSSAVRKSAKEETPERDFSKYLEIPNLQEIMTAKREGIKTGYLFRNSQGREEVFTIPSGSLTLICGQSSHGKTRLLENIALSLAKETESKGEEGDILFFAFEEDYSEICLQFANISANVPQLSKYGTDNTEVLRDYYRTGKLNKATEDKRQTASPGLLQFESLRTNGRLRIFYTPEVYSDELINLLTYLSSKIRIKAVFMDYVQAIYKERNRKDRREELRDICSDLNKTAKKLDIPIVLSAQLNRETSNPTSMSSDNIAESADITRYANRILCLWNSAFVNDLKDKDKYLGSKDYSRLKSRGFTFGEPGKLYCLLTKNRGGIPYPETILSFDGDTGKISENDDLPQGTTGTLLQEYD